MPPPPAAPLLVLAALLALAAPLEAATAVGLEADDFALVDHEGREHRLRAAGEAAVVVLYAWQVGCPIARQDAPELASLAAEWGAKARVLFIDASPQDGPDEVAADARELGLRLPVLLDRSQAIAQGLGITRTGEALVIATRDGRVRWRGPVDDRLGYGAQKPQAARRWLRDAVAAVVAGKDPVAVAPAAKGCRIAFAEEPAPTYADIAPILLQRCSGCHRDGGGAPWAMDSHRRVHGWREMMAETVRTRRMPPYGARSPDHALADDGSLPPDEARRLLRWLEAGAPRGDGPDPLAAPRPAAAEWPLGRPDVVIECPPQPVPATGVIPYRRFELALPAALAGKEVWLRAVDLRPSDPRVMHHAFAFVLPAGTPHRPDDPRFTGLDDFLATYVPGLAPRPFPTGSGKRIPAGATLAFQVHYTTFGKAVTDRPRLALYFAREKPERELRVASARRMDFAIPPGAPDHRVEAEWTARRPITLHAFSPHMHRRGSWMRYDARLPDGTVQRLLEVPRYDLDWQFLYRLAKPVDLPAGTRIQVRGAFDNSAGNEDNPDPEATVRWGEQSWEEMFIGYVEYVER